jgi:hypothetical protein
MRESAEKKKYDLVNKYKRRINKMTQHRLRIMRKLKGCQDACRPEVMQQIKCRELRKKIALLEDKGSESEEARDKIDELYENLQDCHRDMKKYR